MIKFETDSRLVKPGQTFVAIPGHTVDGHDYIESAIKNGASEIVVSKDVDFDIPTIKVSDTEKYLNEELVKTYSKELSELTILALTGTNGKTTTCYLTYQLLKNLGVKVAYMGTIGFLYEDEAITLNNTTPEITKIYQLLMDAKEKGCTHVVMEVSSHALDFKRINGLKFTTVGFTNLTQDHLDYHKTMEAYLKAKLQIIDYLKEDGSLFVNNDDPYASEFISRFKNSYTIGFNNANTNIDEYHIEPDHTYITFTKDNKTYNVTTKLTSKFNVYNYLFALNFVCSLGYSVEDVINITSEILPPKGRCETYNVHGGYAVIDYAHTPDAVEKVIDAYTELKKAKLYTIVGCGGDRDPIKRPIMGNIASEKSDYVYFTNDNPRTEDPNNIMKDIIAGVKKDNYEIILDRKEAIKKAIENMEKDDILLILGKGHEDYQIIGHEKIHLDDSEEVKKYI